MVDAANAQKIRDAATRLKTRGLLQPGDSVSQRLAGTGQIILLTVDADQAMQFTVAQLQDRAPGELLADSLNDTLLRQHLTVYQNRKDVGAVLLNRQQWAAALREVGGGMPGIFDEQIRHLGTRVSSLGHRIVTPINSAFLRNGENAFVLGRQVLCLGMTLDRVVFNAELLEKCAKAFVLASSTGKPVGKIPWLVRWIANGRLMKDERYAAQQYQIGQIPLFKSAY